MTNKIYGQNPSKVDRNQQIWLRYANGGAVADLAVEYGLSEERIYQVIKQVAATIPDEDRSQVVKLRRSYLDQAKTIAMEIAQAPAKPSFAPNGRELLGRDGEPILDNSERLTAVTAALKADERLARLTGTDAPAQQLISVEHDKAKAQEATQEAARKLVTRFPALVRDRAS